MRGIFKRYIELNKVYQLKFDEYAVIPVRFAEFFFLFKNF